MFTVALHVISALDYGIIWCKTEAHFSCVLYAVMLLLLLCWSVVLLMPMQMCFFYGLALSQADYFYFVHCAKQNKMIIDRCEHINIEDVHVYTNMRLLLYCTYGYMYYILHERIRICNLVYVSFAQIKQLIYSTGLTSNDTILHERIRQIYFIQFFLFIYCM